jgi:hypothetical protein
LLLNFNELVETKPKRRIRIEKEYVVPSGPSTMIISRSNTIK